MCICQTFQGPVGLPYEENVFTELAAIEMYVGGLSMWCSKLDASGVVRLLL